MITPPGPPPPPQPPTAAAAKREPSPEEIAAILARVESEHRERFPAEQSSSQGIVSALLKRGVIARLLFATAGLLLISNGLDGLKTRAVSSDSLIAANINNRGGQSLGLGVAMLGLAAMPYASRNGD